MNFYQFSSDPESVEETRHFDNNISRGQNYYLQSNPVVQNQYLTQGNVGLAPDLPFEEDYHEVVQAGMNLQMQQQMIIQKQKASHKRQEIEHEIIDLIYHPEKPRAKFFAHGQKAVHVLHNNRNPTHMNLNAPEFVPSFLKQPGQSSPNQMPNYGQGNGQVFGNGHAANMYGPPLSMGQNQLNSGFNNYGGSFHAPPSNAFAPHFPPNQSSASRQSVGQPTGQPVNKKYIGPIFQVQFKFCVKDFIPAPGVIMNITAGEFVITECDNGYDLGVVTELLTMEQLVEKRLSRAAALDEDDNFIGRILRIASMEERQQLAQKVHDESEVLEMVAQLAHRTYGLPMDLVGIDFQFDRQKLNIYYSSITRVDFRELIKSIFTVYRTRIWMRKVNQSRPFVPQEFAAMSLATGTRFVL